MDRPLVCVGEPVQHTQNEETVVAEEAQRSAASRISPATVVAVLAVALPVALSWTAWAQVDQEWIGIAGGPILVAVLGWAAWTGIAEPWVTTAARAGLAVVLGWAGLAKATEPAALQKLTVDAYQLLPDGLIGPVGIGLPILEIVLAALLLAGFATRLGAVLSGLLMVVFIAGIASAWARGLQIDCGCFGGGGYQSDPPYLGEIMRDMGFLALAAWIVARPPGRLAADRALGLY